MIKNFNKKLVEEPFDESNYEYGKLGNTIELSDKGFCKELVQEMNQNHLMITKLKLKKLIKERKQIVEYMKENPGVTT